MEPKKKKPQRRFIIFLLSGYFNFFLSFDSDFVDSILEEIIHQSLFV